MAQAITNTVKNPFNSLVSGLVSPAPKQGYLGGGTTPPSPFTSGNSLSQLSTGKGLVAPKPAAAAPSWQDNLKSVQDNFFAASGAPRAPAPVQTQNTALMQAPTPQSPVQLGGANSGGTLNPNYNMQTQGMAATGAAPVKGLFSDVVSSLAGKGAGPSPEYTKAQTEAQRYNSLLESSLSNEGSALKTNYLNPIPIGDQEGRAAVIRNQYLAQQQALGSGFQGASTLLGAANTQQSNQQAALSSAGNLAQPNPTSYGQTVFNPVTGDFNGGGGLPPDVMQQYAQMASSGQYAAIPSFITSNPVLNAQLNVAAKALNPNYTPVGAQGASSVLGNIPALQSANTAAEGIKNTIVSYLAANPTLNASDLAVGNAAQQWLQGKQLTDPKYQTLFNYLDEYTNTLAPILGVGGTPTNLKTQIAQGFINSAASGQSIAQVLNAMSQLASNKIQDLQSGAVGGGTSVPNTSIPTGGGFSEAW